MATIAWVQVVPHLGGVQVKCHQVDIEN